MKYFSTNNKNHLVSLQEAVFKGLALDKGLYMPQAFPVMPDNFFKNIKDYSFAGLSFELAKALFGEDIPEAELRSINEDALNFDTPLVEVQKDVFSLELFHGPTLAFKDVGARYMARMLGYFTKGYKKEIHVLVATSGDTGSAVANGFLGVEGVKVHVLYPKGKVSYLQEKQFTTLGQNISALEIDGSFDDCQKLVKEAFVDELINQHLTLTSANSINLARLLPQSFYYFNAFRQLPGVNKKLAVAVPSGNFGNLTAGLIAKKMGLPVDQFIASTNINDVVPEYLTTGIYKARPSIATVANAMDVGDPSNFARILEIYGFSHDAIARDILGFSYTDRQIKDCIAEVNRNHHYLPDPHGATAYLALKEFLSSNDEFHGIFLETAHPAKFSETVEESIGKTVEIPERLENFAKRKKISIPMSKEYAEFRDYLLQIH
ncbi:MAG: threonine synthase [Bacteroidales bacterium]|nr:threonine synthase [Bacteroidales bacterium]